MICPIDGQQCGWRCQTPCNSDQTRLIMEGGGQRLVGPTLAERRVAHEAGKCDAWCSFCITEAERHSGCLPR